MRTVINAYSYTYILVQSTLTQLWHNLFTNILDKYSSAVYCVDRTIIRISLPSEKGQYGITHYSMNMPIKRKNALNGTFNNLIFKKINHFGRIINTQSGRALNIDK